jgi:hypothetical protein
MTLNSITCVCTISYAKCLSYWTDMNINYMIALNRKLPKHEKISREYQKYSEMEPNDKWIADVEHKLI